MTYRRAIALAAALGTVVTAGVAVAQDTLQFKGSWRWATGGTLPATFELYPGRPGEGGYCYGTGAQQRCQDVRITTRGSNYSFTFNGTDWFVMTSPEPNVMTGRYWRNRNNTSARPDATITMRQTIGAY